MTKKAPTLDEQIDALRKQYEALYKTSDFAKREQVRLKLKALRKQKRDECSPFVPFDHE